jgi:TonB family protein
MQPVVGTFEQPEVAARSAPPPSVAARTGDFSTASLTAATGRRSSAVAADAGFGTAEAASTRRDNAALVRPSGFGAPELSDRSSLPAPRSTAGAGFDAPIVPSRHAAKPAAQPPPPAVTPVQILNKPKPRYTEEARRLMIEGEVWLEILFGARGTVTVQRVVRTLGHGLDESAISAAARIQFRPAESNGVPVDQSAIVRVQFQLAN